MTDTLGHLWLRRSWTSTFFISLKSQELHPWHGQSFIVCIRPRPILSLERQHTHTPKSYFLSTWLSESGTFQTARLKGERALAVNTLSHAPAPSCLTLSAFISTPSWAKGPTENHIHEPALSRAQLEFSHCLPEQHRNRPSNSLSVSTALFFWDPSLLHCETTEKSHFLCKYGF